jgi:hypothetical protein
LDGVEGWEAWQRRTSDGAIESEQRVELRAPVVAFSLEGAKQLGSAYWREVERITGGLVRSRTRAGALELRLFGAGPALLRFGRPDVEATEEVARCSYPIEGGLLAQRSAGEITFAQVGGARPVLSSAIRGFFPRLAAREGGPDWTGGLYKHVQSRIHVTVSRRYFARLIAARR